MVHALRALFPSRQPLILLSGDPRGFPDGYAPEIHSRTDDPPPIPLRRNREIASLERRSSLRVDPTVQRNPRTPSRRIDDVGRAYLFRRIESIAARRGSGESRLGAKETASSSGGRARDRATKPRGAIDRSRFEAYLNLPRAILSSSGAHSCGRTINNAPGSLTPVPQR